MYYISSYGGGVVMFKINRAEVMTERGETTILKENKNSKIKVYEILYMTAVAQAVML